MNIPGLATLVVLLASSAAAAAPVKRLDEAALTPASIDAAVNELMKTSRVPGLGLALINDGQVVWERAYGQRDLRRKLPLQTDTVMYGASLTKATFAYFVMQLVDEKKVDLDRPIGAYFPQPLPAYPKYRDLAGDARWQKLTMRMLLDHTSGFANFRWIEEDRKLRFHREPGERYGYSGEGILLAQFVIEEGLKLDVGKEMQRRIFDRLGMKRSSMMWRKDFAANFSEGYTLEGELQPHDQRDNVNAAGSLDTTISEWGRFLAAVSRGEGLSAASKAEMTRRQIEIDSVRQFPTLLPDRTDRWKSIALGYGLGWGVFETKYGSAYFKEGHDDGTANYALCVKRDCILLMSNSTRAEQIFVPLVKRLFGDVPIPAAWEGYLEGP
ncbi:MAG: serine hydrolase domain-containing protein [Pseudomonadota bacterium]